MYAVDSFSMSASLQLLKPSPLNVWLQFTNAESESRFQSDSKEIARANQITFYMIILLIGVFVWSMSIFVFVHTGRLNLDVGPYLLISLPIGIIWFIKQACWQPWMAHVMATFLPCVAAYDAFEQLNGNIFLIMVSPLLRIMMSATSIHNFRVHAVAQVFDCAFIVMLAFEVHPEAHQFVEKVVMPCGVVLIISIFIAYEWEKVTRLQWLSEHSLQLELRTVKLANEHSENQRLQIQAALQAKTDFLTVLSHELRTPLNGMLLRHQNDYLFSSGILGMLQVVNESVWDRERRSFIESALSAAESLSATINAALDLQTLSKSDIKFLLQPVDLPLLLEDLITVFRAAFLPKKIKFTIVNDMRIAHPDLVHIKTNAYCLRQIILNLLSNALKFTPSGGNVCMSISADFVAQGSALNCVATSVSIVHLQITIDDSGIGISTDKFSTLFEPFHCIDHSLARLNSGVGLAIASRLAHSIDGEVTLVKSQLGLGTTFLFSANFELCESDEVLEIDGDFDGSLEESAETSIGGIVVTIEPLVVVSPLLEIASLPSELGAVTSKCVADKSIRSDVCRITPGSSMLLAIATCSAGELKKAPMPNDVFRSIPASISLAASGKSKSSAKVSEDSPCSIYQSPAAPDTRLGGLINNICAAPTSLSPLTAIRQRRVAALRANEISADSFMLSPKQRAGRVIGVIPNLSLVSRGGSPPLSLAQPLARQSIEPFLQCETSRGSPGIESLWSTPMTTRPLNILVAEDNLINQKFVIALLEKLGHTVVLAENGALAVALYRRSCTPPMDPSKPTQKPFDICLMDIGMPVMDGLVAAREIRLFELSLNISDIAPISSLPIVIDQTCITSVNVTAVDESVSHIGITPIICRRRPIPIIAVTAQLECDFRQKCINAGMQDFICKPIKRTELVKKMDTLACASVI